MVDNHSSSSSTSFDEFEAFAKFTVLLEVISTLVRITSEMFDGKHYAE